MGGGCDHFKMGQYHVHHARSNSPCINSINFLYQMSPYMNCLQQEYLFLFFCFLIRMIFYQGEKMLGDNPRIIR